MADEKITLPEMPPPLSCGACDIVEDGAYNEMTPEMAYIIGAVEAGIAGKERIWGSFCSKHLDAASTFLREIRKQVRDG